MDNILSGRIEAELLDGLNAIQKEAVLHPGGPLLILAGAGSGKTRVITHRIAHLCRIRSVRPYRIAAVTFTNKAAGEMKARLGSLLGPMARELMVKTFHSLGLHILTRNYAAAELRSNFAIYDSSAQESLLKGILRDLKIPSETLTPSVAAHEINRARDAMRSPGDTERSGSDFYSDMLARVYRLYTERLRSNNAVDFGDLLYRTVRLLETNREVLDDYSGLWQHFMIDEYQDTNRAQYRLGAMLAGQHRNIVVVGDDDQSIYSWRGADITNILNFERDYPEAVVLRLEENYRSTPQILDAAWNVIHHNTSRREKQLYTNNAPGAPVRCTQYRSESGEGGDTGEVPGVVQRIQKLRGEGVSLSDVAVFYRTNAQSRLFEEGLRRAGLPYVVIGGARFYDRREIKDIMAYLSYVVNPDDSLSLMRVINVPPRGLGDAGLQRLESFVPVAGGWEAAMERSGELSGLRAVSKLQALALNIRRWRAMYERGELPSAIAQSVLDDTGYVEWVHSEATPEAESRVENLREFVHSVQEYEERSLLEAATGGTEDDEDSPFRDTASLGAFLQGITLLTSETDPANSVEIARVSLMTLHNAKGLEFSYVFITGMEEGFIPHSFSVDEGNIEEERRLIYVGITRAKRELALSAAAYRRIFGSYQPRLPSRFLLEMAPAGIKLERAGAAGSYPAAERGVRAGAPVRKPAGSRYVDGERVRHAKYGEGTIVGTDDTPSGQKISIEFDSDARIRTFLTDYTPISSIK